MDKLTNVQIEDNRLTFTVDSNIDITDYELKVYIDEVCNIKNILDDSPEHDISIDEIISADSHNNVIVTNDEAILPLDWNMKYITLECYSSDTGEELHFHGIYYNPAVIYNAEVRKLHTYCSTCLDDKTMQMIMLVVFKRQLLEYAIEADQFKEAVQIYIDICRLLEISLGCARGGRGDGNGCCNNCILTQKAKCLNTEDSRCLKLERDRQYKSIPYSNCSNGYCKIR